MNGTLETSLREAAERTFEQVVLLMPTRSTAGRPDAPRRAMASVAFSGPSDGVLQLWVAESFLPRLTSRIIGGPQALDRGLQLDALGELANIICGVVLPSIAPNCSFEQAPPCIVGPATHATDAAHPTAAVRLAFDDSVAEVVLFLFDRAA
jgi:hypothetical protein